MAKTQKEVQDKVRSTDNRQNVARRSITSNYDEQYILFKYLKDIIKYKQVAEEKNPDSMKLQKIIELDARPRECANLFHLQKAEEVKGFLQARPAEYAYLIPEIKLYKPTRNDDGELIDRLVYMPDHALAKGYGEYPNEPTTVGGRDPDELREMERIRSPDERIIYTSTVGTNCGIMSFNFDETQKNFGFSGFRGNLVMNFASLRDFRDSEYVDLIDPRPDGEPEISPEDSRLPDSNDKKELLAQQLELIDSEKGSKKRNITKRSNPALKIVCGWAMPNTSAELQIPRDSGLYDYVRTSKRTLILHLSKFKVNFQQNGQVSLDFGFVASVESFLKRAESDIFGTGKLDKVPAAEIQLDQIPTKDRILLSGADARLEIRQLLDQAGKDKVKFVKVTEEQLDRDLRRVKLLQNAEKDDKAVKKFKNITAALRNLQTREKQENITKTRRRFMDKIVGRSSRESGVKLNKLFEFAVPGSDVGFGYDRTFTVRSYDFKRKKTADESSKYTVPFIFLSDILDVAAEVGFRKNGNIVLGTIPAPGFKRNRISIGDLPIALETFNIWFNDVIGNSDRQKVPFYLFLTKLLQKIIAKNTFNLRGLSQLGGKIPDLSFNLMSVSADHFGDKLKPGSKVRRSQFLNARRTTVKTASNQFFDVDKRVDLVFITTEPSIVTKGLRGSYEQDIKRGIYHFVVGSDRGPLQSIQFTEMDNQHLATENILNAANKSTSMLENQIMPQNVTMSLKGNNLLATNSQIYIDVTFGLGRKVAERLRLGGYYRITSINQSFSPAGWTTEVSAICTLDSRNIRNSINRRNQAVDAATDRRERNNS